MCFTNRGYTLLELCIVLAIMSAMAGMTVPLFRNMAKEEELWSVVRSIRTAAGDCRRLAIQTGQARTLEIDESGLRFSGSSGGRFPSNRVQVEVQDSARREWRRTLIEWVFQPSGLCDPLSIRLRSPNGWIEQHFSPLTATVEEETWSFH